MEVDVSQKIHNCSNDYDFGGDEFTNTDDLVIMLIQDSNDNLTNRYYCFSRDEFRSVLNAELEKDVCIYYEIEPFLYGNSKVKIYHEPVMRIPYFNILVDKSILLYNDKTAFFAFKRGNFQIESSYGVGTIHDTTGLIYSVVPIDKNLILSNLEEDSNHIIELKRSILRNISVEAQVNSVDNFLIRGVYSPECVRDNDRITNWIQNYNQMKNQDVSNVVNKPRENTYILSNMRYSPEARTLIVSNNMKRIWYVSQYSNALLLVIVGNDAILSLRDITRTTYVDIMHLELNLCPNIVRVEDDNIVSLYVSECLALKTLRLPDLRYLHLQDMDDCVIICVESTKNISHLMLNKINKNPRNQSPIIDFNKLMYLYAEDSNIDLTDRNIRRPLNDLIWLNISNNRFIRNLGSNSFTNLRYLNCENCKNITDLPRTLTKLVYLNINNTNITSIPYTYVKLKYLLAYNSKLKHIHDTFTNLRVLLCDRSVSLVSLPRTCHKMMFLSCVRTPQVQRLPEMSAELVYLNTNMDLRRRYPRAHHSNTNLTDDQLKLIFTVDEIPRRDIYDILVQISDYLKLVSEFNNDLNTNIDTYHDGIEEEGYERELRDDSDDSEEMKEDEDELEDGEISFREIQSSIESARQAVEAWPEQNLSAQALPNQPELSIDEIEQASRDAFGDESIQRESDVPRELSAEELANVERELFGRDESGRSRRIRRRR